MKEPPGFFDHGGEKLKRTVPLLVIFKGPAPKVARQYLTLLPTDKESQVIVLNIVRGQTFQQV
jgi:hypothetical protein